ncbi:MAG: hypothetical protein ACRD3S_03120, partial [Terracidiphilus sp.]
LRRTPDGADQFLRDGGVRSQHGKRTSKVGVLAVVLLFLSNSPATVSTEREGCSLDESMREVREAGGFGSKPLGVSVS